MSWPCPNGCPRDAGEYCARHSCKCCSEILKPEDDIDFCKVCLREAADRVFGGAGMELEEPVQCEKCDKMITLESDYYFDGVTSYCEKCVREDDASNNDLSTEGVTND